MTNKLKYIFFVGFVLINFCACEKTEDEPPAVGAYDEGVFVVNEGVFGSTSGSITYYDPSTGKTEQKIFEKANGRQLGDVVQSMHIHKDRAYIVVNNSNKIEVVDRQTFEEVGQILDLELPRYFLPINDTLAYVTEWGSDGLTGRISVLNLNSLTIEKRINTQQKGPERMWRTGAYVLVVNSGGFGEENTLTVLDYTTHSVVQHITLDYNPNDIISFPGALALVVCGGKTVYSTYPNIDTAQSTVGGLWEVDLNTFTANRSVESPKGKGFNQLMVDPTPYFEAYYYRKDGAVWRLKDGQEELWIDRNFYGIGIEGEKGHLYAATYNGVDRAWVHRYQLNEGAFIFIDSFQVGQFANEFVFVD